MIFLPVVFLLVEAISLCTWVRRHSVSEIGETNKKPSKREITKTCTADLRAKYVSYPGNTVVKSQAHFPPIFCGTQFCWEMSFSQHASNLSKIITWQAERWHLNFSDTLTNKVILLTDTRKDSPGEAKAELHRSNYKPGNWPWQATRASGLRFR